MKNLEIYQSHFSQAYPDYVDSEYAVIEGVIKALPSIEAAAKMLDSDEAKNILSLIIPLIQIKNYKSQIPFPVALFDAIKLIVEIRNTAPSNDVSKEHVELFKKFIDVKGFQLPTISAVFHFCHPQVYPIVDRNIEAACGLLSNECPEDLDEKLLPSLPASKTSSKNKLAKYRAFISFLTTIKELHNEKYNTVYEFRDLDKALMVYGVSTLKKSAEMVANNLPENNLPNVSGL